MHQRIGGPFDYRPQGSAFSALRRVYRRDGRGLCMLHLMGGGLNEMNLMIRTMVGNLSGIVCDGAKTSCALKIYSSVEAASLAMRMALNGEAPGRESGIIGADAMESIDNLMNISHNGMADIPTRLFCRLCLTNNAKAF